TIEVPLQISDGSRSRSFGEGRKVCASETALTIRREDRVGGPLGAGPCQPIRSGKEQIVDYGTHQDNDRHEGYGKSNRAPRLHSLQIDDRMCNPCNYKNCKNGNCNRCLSSRENKEQAQQQKWIDRGLGIAVCSQEPRDYWRVNF